MKKILKSKFLTFVIIIVIIFVTVDYVFFIEPKTKQVEIKSYDSSASISTFHEKETHDRARWARSTIDKTLNSSCKIGEKFNYLNSTLKCTEYILDEGVTCIGIVLKGTFSKNSSPGIILCCENLSISPACLSQQNLLTHDNGTLPAISRSVVSGIPSLGALARVNEDSEGKFSTGVSISFPTNVPEISLNVKIFTSSDLYTTFQINSITSALAYGCVEPHITPNAGENCSLINYYKTHLYMENLNTSVLSEMDYSNHSINGGNILCYCFPLQQKDSYKILKLEGSGFQTLYTIDYQNTTDFKGICRNLYVPYP